MSRSYSEMLQFKTYAERVEYLKLDGSVGVDTFGFDRYLNQNFYTSKQWKEFRHKVIIRDKGCDLGLDGYELNDKAYIHHINPITKEMLLNNDPTVFDMNNVICCSFDTHQYIHYGIKNNRPNNFVERTKNDTCPWRNK